jgi:hypothetical protein
MYTMAGLRTIGMKALYSMRALTGALLTCGALLAPACATLLTRLPGEPVAWATICTLTLWPGPTDRPACK